MDQPTRLLVRGTTPPPAITARPDCSFVALCNGAVLKYVFWDPYLGGKTHFERVFSLLLCVVTCWETAVLRNEFLTCRWRFGVDRRRGGDKGREEEGSKRSFGVEGGALRGQILTAAHAAVDLKVQGLRFLLEGSVKKRKSKGRKWKRHISSTVLTQPAE